MRSRPPKKKSSNTPPRDGGPVGPEQRVSELLLRLETSGPNPVQAAEEVDRMQAAVQRAGIQEEVLERVQALCDAWSEIPLRGDQAQAWIVLVGAFDLKEHTERVAELAKEFSLAPPLRERAIRVLARLGGEEALSALQGVLLSGNNPASVRVAAAETLATTGDRTLAPLLASLLDEELPRPVWNAVAEALERLR